MSHVILAKGHLLCSSNHPFQLEYVKQSLGLIRFIRSNYVKAGGNNQSPTEELSDTQVLLQVRNKKSKKKIRLGPFEFSFSIHLFT